MNYCNNNKKFKIKRALFTKKFPTLATTDDIEDGLEFTKKKLPMNYCNNNRQKIKRTLNSQKC